MMERRQFITMALGGLALAVMSPVFKAAKALAAEMVEKLSKTNEEWKKLLTPTQYNVLREEGTERPFTSPLLDEHREGIFACIACDLPLFPSKFKFDSGTGWPSFYDSIQGHIETKNDYALIMPRTEYHCARCGGHHGHVFEDGPKPTGLRYCNNGVVLKFIPKEA
jgi:peptide-methionine (R)-S-oxide reductase